MIVTPTAAGNALTKCIVWFNDGNVRTFYSLDKPHKKARPRKALGIHRLEKMLMKTFRGQWRTAVIYDNYSMGQPLIMYKAGRRVWTNF